MSKAIVCTVIWGVAYFVIFYLASLFFPNCDLPKDSQLVVLAAAATLGFYFGFRQRERRPDCNTYLNAIGFCVIYICVAVLLRLLTNSAESIQQHLDAVLPQAAAVCYGYVSGCLNSSAK